MSLKRNVICLTVEKAVHTLGGFACMVMVARVLGTDLLADYGFAISLTAFFIPLLDLGMNNRIIKIVASGDSLSRILHEVISYKVTIAPLAFILMVGGGQIWGGAHVVLLVALIGLSTLAVSLGDSANAVFKGLQRSDLSCCIISALNVVLVLSLYLAMRWGGDLVTVGWCYAFSRIGYCAAAFVLLHRVCPDTRLSFRIGIDWQSARSGCLHLPGIYYLGNLLYLSYLATYILSPAEAGVYYVGYRAAAATYVLVSAGFEAVLASAVKEGARPSGMGMWFVIYSLIVMLLLFLLAPLTIYVFGEAFVGSVRPIRLLASCVPPFALCGLAHTLLMAARHERFAAVAMAVLLGGGFGMAFAFEYFYGPETTALAPAAASMLAVVALWGGLSRRLATPGRSTLIGHDDPVY